MTLSRTPVRRTGLLIAYEAALVPPGGEEVLACLAAPVKRDGWDAAGFSFHHYALRQAGLLDEPEVGDSSEEATSAPDGAEPAAGATSELDDKPPPGTSWKSRGKKKKPKQEDRKDLYALLGLQHERWTATEAQIKLAYRKVALEKHPDKAGAAIADPETKSRIEEDFKSIQEAYETLSDPARRREFDSTDAFDDSLPSDCAPEDFYKVFGPAFRRNARWSVNTPVPGFGESSTPWADVESFYDFWFQFKSWREFPHPDEEDLEHAECREERRWLERHNAKLREAGKKDEKRRLKQFVEDAYRRDPRVVAQKEFERSERERKRREKAEAAAAKQRAEQAARLAAERRAAEEAARAAEDAAEARKSRAKEKKAMQKERSRLRSLCSDLGGVDDYGMERLCSRLSLEDLSDVISKVSLESTPEPERRRFLETRIAEVSDEGLSSQEAREQAAQTAERAAAAQRREAAAAKAAKARTWDAEEVRMLEKALVKFPQGTAKRWEQVSAYVRTRTVDEVVEMVKHGLKSGRMAPKQNGVTVAKKRQGNTVIHSAPSQRDEAFTDVTVPQQDPVENGVGAAPGPAAPAHANGGSPAGEERQGDASEAWSEAQELALIKALKQYGKELPDRWERISKAVAGQSKAACMRRFKELRQTVRAKKAT